MEKKNKFLSFLYAIESLLRENKEKTISSKFLIENIHNHATKW